MKVNYGYLCQWLVFLPILLPIMVFCGLFNIFHGIIKIIKNDIIETSSYYDTH
jgi:hypothetical protein